MSKQKEPMIVQTFTTNYQRLKAKDSLPNLHFATFVSKSPVIQMKKIRKTVYLRGGNVVTRTEMEPPAPTAFLARMLKI